MVRTGVAERSRLRRGLGLDSFVEDLLVGFALRPAPGADDDDAAAVVAVVARGRGLDFVAAESGLNLVTALRLRQLRRVAMMVIVYNK